MDENSTTKSALEAQLERSICFNDFEQPKLQPCFHVFCKSQCLDKPAATNGCSLDCPTCQHTAPLSEKGVDGLQSDFHIDHLIEDQDAFDKAAEPTETHCGNCEGKTATGYCKDCEDFLCDECQVAHKKIRKFRGHKLLSLEECQSQNIIPPALQNCPKHPENTAKIYCETCSTLICTDCTIRLHRDHNYDLATDVYHKRKEELVSSLKPIKEKLEVVTQALKAFDTRAKEISDQRTVTEAQIHEEMDQQQQVFDQRRAQLVDELDMLTEQKLKTLAVQKDQVEITKTSLTSYLECAEDSLHTTRENEILAINTPALKRVEQVSAELALCQEITHPKAEVDVESITDMKVQFEQDCAQLLESAAEKLFDMENSYITGVSEIMTIGEQKTVVFHALSQENEEYRSKINLKAKLEHTKSKDRVQCEVVKKQNGQHKINYRPVKRGKHELHLTVDGNPVRGSPFPIAVTPSAQSLNKPQRVVRDLDCPRNITINSKQQIIAVHGNGACISILTLEEEKTITYKGSAKGHLKNAFGVTVDKDDNIYVAGCGNHAILKFSPEGKFITALGCNGRKQLQFHSPVGIFYNHRDNYLYVADQCNHRIQVLTTDLKFVRVFGRKGSKDGQYNLPFNIAFDDANNLHVTDHYNDRVQVLTTEGQFLRTFSQKANGKKLYRPWAIAIDSSNTVYVSENGPHCVSVFTSQGDYITTFGGEGSEEGQFEKIHGLFIDDNDTIIASDLNGRLQFY